MRIYATKQEIKTVCASCGRTYVDVLIGVTKSEGAIRCPRCTLLRALPEIHKKGIFSDGVKDTVRDLFLNGPNGKQKKSSKNK